MPLGARGRYAPQNTFLQTLAEKFDGTISNFVLGNAQSSKDYPIVYCSDGFCDLTGYSRTEVMSKGCACKFLVGIDTDRDAQYKIITSLNEKTELKTEILFYKKNGAPFSCLLDLMPIKNEGGDVVLFLVSHKDVTKQKLSLSTDRLDPSSNSLGNGFVSETPVPRLRKFSRDVLLHIQRQYGAKGSISKNRNKFSPGSSTVGESSSFIPQYKLENAKLPKFMILHFGRPRLIWDWIILLLVCYIAIMVPFSVAFKTHDHTKQLIVADTIVEIFFIIDIVINFRTTYIDKKSGRIITQQKLIALHYLKGWFIVDFLAALPFEALYFANHSWGFLVSLLKTGRLLRLFRIARRISRYIEYTAALLGLLMFSFALLGHWFACIWYVIGYEELENRETNGWLYSLGDQMGRPYVNKTINGGPSKGDAYISSLYFILTSLTTVGFGNIAPNTAAEKIFSVVVLLLGALMQSAIFGNMTAIIQKLYSVRARFHAKANEIKQFVRLHRIENDLKRRIEDYFLTHWSVSKGVDTDEMLESFPSELRADICLHMYKNFLGLSCFSGTSRGCCRLLSLKVQRAFFGPGELIIKEKDAIDAIFFVNSGTIEIVQKDCIVAILGSGDLFGEDVSRKLPVCRSNGDVRALTYCDLLYLTRSNLLGVLHLYPDFAESFSQKLEMTFNLGARDRDLSTCGPLDSITEGDEEDAETTDDDTQEERALLNDSRINSPTSPPLPLWQRRIKNMESLKSLTASLQEKLMQIESQSSISGSSEDEDDKQANVNNRDQCLRRSGRESMDMHRMEENRCSVNEYRCLRINDDITFSQESIIADSDELKETSFIDAVSSNHVTASSQCDGSIDVVLFQPVTRDESSDEIYTESDQSEKQECAAEHNQRGQQDPINTAKTADSLNAIERRSFISRCRITENALGYVDTQEGAGKIHVSPNLSRRNVHHDAPFDDNFENSHSNVNDNTIMPNGEALAQINAVGNCTAFARKEDSLAARNKWGRSDDMSWDILYPSFTDDPSEIILSPENEAVMKSTSAKSCLDIPKHKYERLSSGIFSRFSDSESDILNSTNVAENVNLTESGSISGNLILHNKDNQISTSDVATDEENSKAGESIDFFNESYSQQYLCNAEAKMALPDTKEIDQKGKNVPFDKESIFLNHLVKDVAESKQRILGMTAQIDRIGNDVECLKQELTTLTSMIRILIEQQNKSS